MGLKSLNESSSDLCSVCSVFCLLSEESYLKSCKPQLFITVREVRTKDSTPERTLYHHGVALLQLRSACGDVNIIFHCEEVSSTPVLLVSEEWSGTLIEIRWGKWLPHDTVCIVISNLQYVIAIFQFSFQPFSMFSAIVRICEVE